MTTTKVDSKIEVIAAGQAGRFTRAQVRSVTDNASGLIGSRMRSGRWRRLTRRVLCLPGAPVGWRGEIWTAYLHVGQDSVVSHRSAGLLHGLPGIEVGPASLTLPAGCHRRYPDGELYQRRDLPPGQREVIVGLPVTSVARTIVDLASGASRPRIEAWLDHCTAERLVTPDDMRRTLESRAAWGKRSVATLEEVLTDYLPGEGVPQGRLERELDKIVQLAGIPRGLPQFGHPGEDSSSELVDRAWLQTHLIVECDGRRWHERRRAARVDRRRDVSAAEEGWQTIRFGHEELVCDPEGCARQLRTIYEQRMVDQIANPVADDVVAEELVAGHA
ncbi:MAG: DUF559 domain-containing protein [Microthrixaceae bacterium]